MVTSNGIDSAVLKAKFGNDIRKTEIHHTQDLNFNDLVLMMQRFFQIKPTDSVSLKYRDSEKDWITLANDDDVSFALRHEPLLFVEVQVDAGGDENFSTSPPVLTQQQQKPVAAIHAADHQDEFDQKSVLSQTPKSTYQDNGHQQHAPPSAGLNDTTTTPQAPPTQPHLQQQPPPPAETPQSALIGSGGHQSQPLFVAASQTPTYGQQPPLQQQQQQSNCQPQPFGVALPPSQQLCGAPTPTFGGGPPPVAPLPSRPPVGDTSHAQPPPPQTFYSSSSGGQPLATVPSVGGQLPPFGAINNGTPTGFPPHSAYQPQTQQQIAPPPLSSAAGPGGYTPQPPVSYPYQPAGSNNGYPPASIPTGGPPMFSQQQPNAGGNPFARAAQPPGGRPPGAYYQ